MKKKLNKIQTIKMTIESQLSHLNQCWLSTHIVGKELIVSDLGAWNHPRPKFTLGNQIELKPKGFNKIPKLGSELTLGS
jgi:hypothetical protein